MSEIEPQAEELTPAGILESIKDYIDEDGFEFLREQVEESDESMDAEEVLGTIHGQLLEQGEDPDAVFLELGFTEQE